MFAKRNCSSIVSTVMEAVEIIKKMEQPVMKDARDILITLLRSSGEVVLPIAPQVGVHPRVREVIKLKDRDEKIVLDSLDSGRGLSYSVSVIQSGLKMFVFHYA